jgi:predicted ester cyclase
VTVDLPFSADTAASAAPSVAADRPVSVLAAIAVRSIHLMAAGERAEFEPLYHPAATDHENRIQPPSSRVSGPAGFWSTAQWLRAAFAGLHYEIHHTITDDDLVAVNSSMIGTHATPWAVYAEDGSIDTVFPPTRRPFTMSQSHWFRFRDEQIVEHWANRDDLGMARQLEWIPPSPAFLIRMALAKRGSTRMSTSNTGAIMS